MSSSEVAGRYIGVAGVSRVSLQPHLFLGEKGFFLRKGSIEVRKTLVLF